MDEPAPALPDAVDPVTDVEPGHPRSTAVPDGASTDDPVGPGAAGSGTVPAAGPGADEPHPRPARRRPALLATAGALLLVLGLVLGYLLGGATGKRAEATGAAASPSYPTMLGQVLAVPDGQTATVRAGDQVFDVSVLGLDGPTLDDCGASGATALASATLVGQTVTLVPDPTVPEFDEQGRRLSYVVLRSQQNYTDVALAAGAARADTVRPLWYARFFLDEEATARAQGRGIWGPPCDGRG